MDEVSFLIEGKESPEKLPDFFYRNVLGVGVCCLCDKEISSHLISMERHEINCRRHRRFKDDSMLVISARFQALKMQREIMESRNKVFFI